jgi:hypothetical protein
MKRSIDAFLAIACLTVTTLQAADGPARIHYFGNSLTDQLKYDDFQDLAAAAGHPLEWKREMAPGVPVLHHWRMKHRWENKLTEEHWDVVTLQPFQNFELEFLACENFARFLAEKQPDAQLYIYAQWQARRSGNWLADFLARSEVVPDDPDRGWTASCRKKTGEDFYLEQIADDAKQAGMTVKVERSLKNQYELTVQGLRARVPMNGPVKLIPVGHVLELLASKMQAGLVPGYHSPYDFYIDGVHLNNVGSYVVACTFYATIFRTNPIGLPVGGYQADPRHHSNHFPLSEEVARVIQETAWEVVATHPLTGVTSDREVKVATASLADAVQSEPYRCQLYHAFGQSPCTWKVASGKLPAGLSLDETGLISGVVTGNPGQYGLALAVRDAKGMIDRREMILAVEPDIAPDIVTPAELPQRRLGEYFALRLEAKDGNGAMQWEPVKRDGGLPPGLMLHPDGTLSGSPGQEGSHEFELKVTDADGGQPESATQTFKLTVSPPGPGIFRARYTDQPIKADGVLDEAVWELKQPIEKLVAGEKTNVRATFDVVHKGGDFYVAVKVVDPDRHVKLDNLPDGDSVEVFIDVLNNREQVYNFDDRRVAIAPTEKWYQPLRVAPMSFGHSGKCSATEDGYTAEFWFSAWALGLKNRNFPVVLGLDIAINDDDDGDGRESQVVWQGTAENDTRPNQFGTLILEPEE